MNVFYEQQQWIYIYLIELFNYIYIFWYIFVNNIYVCLFLQMKSILKRFLKIPNHDFFLNLLVGHLCIMCMLHMVINI